MRLRVREFELGCRIEGEGSGVRVRVWGVRLTGIMGIVRSPVDF